MESHDRAAGPLTRADFGGRTVLVCGAGVAGQSAARALLALGARTLVTDSVADAADRLPAQVRFLGAIDELPDGLDAVVTSPGLPPSHPLLVSAATAGVPVLGELEFAWRIRGERPAAWLMVTGTNGKTTTVRMLESILRAGGRSALAVGNVGVPVIDAVLAGPDYDVLAVEASSFQLHHSSTLAPVAGALLNLAPDHLDWHGSMAAYAADKAKVWGGGQAIANADDPGVMALLDAVSPQHQRVTFTLAEPAVGQYGLRAGELVDGAGRAVLDTAAVRPAGRHNLANALAACALAGAVAVTPAQCASGLAGFVPDPHRNDEFAEVAGIRWVDDSKATNPHAAAASLRAYDSIVWVAGGQLKGAPVDDLVAEFAPAMRGAVLLGADRELIAAALTRHAPDLPVIIVSRTDDGAMQDVVRAAASLAAAGDVVLLAPAAASKDMFASYGERGLAFQREVAAIAGSRAGEGIS